jgi:hypothetical protein
MRCETFQDIMVLKTHRKTIRNQRSENGQNMGILFTSSCQNTHDRSHAYLNIYVGKYDDNKISVAKENLMLKMTKLQSLFSQNSSFRIINFEPP